MQETYYRYNFQNISKKNLPEDSSFSDDLSEHTLDTSQFNRRLSVQDDPKEKFILE